MAKEKGAVSMESRYYSCGDADKAPVWDDNNRRIADEQAAAARRGVGSFAVPGLPEAVWCGFSGDAQDDRGGVD
jgi:hypothetical protein